MTWAAFTFILAGIPLTLGVTAAAFVLGGILGFPILFTRRSRFYIARISINIVINIVRGIPSIVWLFLLFFGIGSEYFNISAISSAVIVFGVISGVNISEIYRGALISIPFGHSEAANALNIRPHHTFIDIMLPQLLRVALPSLATYFIGVLKDSAIASTIGVAELAYRGSQVSQTNFEGLRVFAVVGCLYILLSLPIAWVSRSVDKRLRRRLAQ